MKRRHSFLRRPLGFTLIEVLVVTAILGILASLSFAALSSARRKTLRTSCLSNIRQLAAASQIYASDNSRGALSGTKSDTDDDANWLYPQYIAETRVLICPATRNRIDTKKSSTDPHSGRVFYSDLQDSAADNTGNGTSYEIFGFMNAVSAPLTESGFNAIGTPDGIQKTTATVHSYPHKNNAFGLAGLNVGASDIWMFTDSDSGRGGRQNYPDPSDHHGAAGANVGFCDGSARWIPRANYVRAYELSQDENRDTP